MLFKKSLVLLLGMLGLGFIFNKPSSAQSLVDRPTRTVLPRQHRLSSLSEAELNERLLIDQSNLQNEERERAERYQRIRRGIFWNHRESIADPQDPRTCFSRYIDPLEEEVRRQESSAATSSRSEDQSSSNDLSQRLHDAWELTLRCLSEHGGTQYQVGDAQESSSNGLLQSLTLKGRIAFRDPWGCSVSIASQGPIAWSECHQFKKNFNSVSGDALTLDQASADSLRPLRGLVRIKLYRRLSAEQINALNSAHDENTILNLNRLCGSSDIYTDINGFYESRIQSNCSLAEVSAYQLEYVMKYRQSDSRDGIIAAVWSQSRIEALNQAIIQTNIAPSDNLFDSENIQFRDSLGFLGSVGTQAAIPKISEEFEMTDSLRGQWSTSLANHEPISLSVWKPLDETNGASRVKTYYQHLFSNYQTVIELAKKLKENLQEHFNDYEKLFRRFDVNHEKYFIVYLDNQRGVLPHSGIDGIHFLGPTLLNFSNETELSYGLSSTGSIAHEFGHAIHRSLAHNGFRETDYSFAGPLMRRPSHSRGAAVGVYDLGHSGGQFQEMNVSFSEGAASALGQYLLNGCEHSGWTVQEPRPSITGATQFSLNMWNGDDTCYGLNDGCNFGHIAFQLAHRKLQFNSPQWNERVQQLRLLTSRAVSEDVGHSDVVTNSESRYGELLCDLLDHNQDISYLHGRATNRRYVKDFTYLVSEVLNGQPVPSPLPVSRYSNLDPNPENITLNLKDFLDSLNKICDEGACSELPMPGTISENYNRLRISARWSPFSPTHLGTVMMNLGLVTAEEFRNLLRVNLMEPDFF